MDSASEISTIFGMATDMFRGAGGDDDDVRERGETTAVRVGNPLAGNRMGRLLKGIDTVPYHAAPIAYTASADAAPDDSEAVRLRDQLLRFSGMDDESPELQYAFIRAMCLCHALNSASKLTPGRATFTVAGTSFSYTTHVVEVLGDNLRRFFRAWADETLEVVVEQLEKAKEGDVEALRVKRDLVVMANKKGLLHMPQLAFDTAEYVTKLSPSERMAVANAKAISLPAGPDQVNNPRVPRMPSGPPPGPVLSSAASDADY